MVHCSIIAPAMRWFDCAHHDMDMHGAAALPPCHPERAPMPPPCHPERAPMPPPCHPERASASEGSRCVAMPHHCPCREMVHFVHHDMVGHGEHGIGAVLQCSLHVMLSERPRAKDLIALPCLIIVHSMRWFDFAHHDMEGRCIACLAMPLHVILTELQRGKDLTVVHCPISAPAARWFDFAHHDIGRAW